MIEVTFTVILALPLIKHHHERLDGTGYPDGLGDGRIPLLVRIVSVVDVYDALASVRPYKPALPRDECFEHLHGEAALGWWDPDVVEVLENVI